MSPTEQLKAEHEGIKLALKILEAVCRKIETRDKVDPKDLADILEFITVFADKCHHGKEEDLLFPAMVEAGVPREGGPIEVMLAEHNEGRGYVRQMKEAQGKEFVEPARNYINLLTQHIDKEDNILYMIADMHLAEEKQKGLLEQFEKVEKEKIGEGKHEEFHKLLEKLSNVYLK